MSDQKQGFLAQIKSYPAQFWVANTMEIFERMSWYGWFTVMALYVTGSVETGGLGFSTETRGALQAIVPFFLYIFPVFTGALADRFGFKRTFIVAYGVMIVSYYMLGQFTSLPAFFVAFMFVAVGAALFKPVVVGTVAKVTDEGNSATGFGIFYMMVNIGGFFGPIVAGKVRGLGWEWVFVACSIWAAVNLLIVLLFYREPEFDQSQREGSFRKIFDNMVEVLGNVRFFLTVFVILFALMFANLRVGFFEQITWTKAWIFIVAWLAFNLVWDRLLPAGSGKPESQGGMRRNALARRMYCSNWRFALFLLIMSGFWTSFNQIFYTMPEYIRDFVETKPLLDLAGHVHAIPSLLAGLGLGAVLLIAGFLKRSGGLKIAAALPVVVFGLVAWAVAIGWFDRDRMATINDLERAEIANKMGMLMATSMSEGDLQAASADLTQSKVRLSPEQIRGLVEKHGTDAAAATDEAIATGRQMNPEFIVNINAGGIVLFQVFISFLMARFHRFTTMILGMVVAAVGLTLSAFAGGDGHIGMGALVWFVAGGILIFSFGEMMASPTSQEYVGRIAPDNKKALYMGYYFVAVALGNLFGGILSGELYGRFARDMGRPELMWLAFGAVMLFTAVIFLIYDRFAVPRHQNHNITAS